MVQTRERIQRPNVLCIITDQQRADHLGCAGNSVLQTPNVDRLARSGMRFSRSYVNNPICCPSRATMWTGQSANVHGLRGNGIPLDPRVPTFVGALAQAGYRTHGVGKLHLSPWRCLNGADRTSLNPAEWPESKELWEDGRIGGMPGPYYGLQSALFVGGHGDFIWGDYKRWLLREAPEVVRNIDAQVAELGRENWNSTGPSLIPAEIHHSHWIADRVIEFLQEQSQTGQPFFCWCSFPDPHHPYHAPDPYHSMYDPADMPTPRRREGELDVLPPFYQRVRNERFMVNGLGGPATRFDQHTPEIIARTYGMISNVDANVGRILDALEALGMQDNTMIVYLSDHGDMMGDHWLHQKGPFHFDGLIRVPSIWSWPGHIAPGVTNDSIVSMLELAPTILDFCNVPIPEGPTPAVPFLPNQLPPWPGHSLRPILEGSTASVRDAAFISHDDDIVGLRLRTLITERYRLTWYGGQPFGELFDLQEDPLELYSRWDDPGYRAVRNELAVRLLEEAVMTDSRLPRRLAGV